MAVCLSLVLHRSLILSEHPFSDLRWRGMMERGSLPTSISYNSSKKSIVHRRISLLRARCLLFPFFTLLKVAHSLILTDDMSVRRGSSPIVCTNSWYIMASKMVVEILEIYSVQLRNN